MTPTATTLAASPSSIQREARSLAVSWRSRWAVSAAPPSWPGGAGRAHHGAITVPEDRFAEARARLQERAPLLERDGLVEFALGAPWNSQRRYPGVPGWFLPATD